MHNKILGTDEMWRREELVATIPGAFDVGVGADACAQTGMGGRALSRLLLDYFHDFTDGGADLVELTSGPDVVRLYVRRRGRLVDVGTRKDFTELGWQAICDIIDAKTST
jgi:hypothetical protein